MGFSRVAWKMTNLKPNGSCAYITFRYNSSNGDQGFPGDVRAEVTYIINENYHLSINMKAQTLNKATPMNMATHLYWNLNGHMSGNISSEQLQLFASKITNVDEELVPDGTFSVVNNTPYDFHEPVKIGTQLEKLPDPTKVGSVRGFDINYVVDGYQESDKHRMKKVAILYDEKSGIKMELNATAPGVQLFTANSLKDRKGKEGALYQAYAGVCLETQDFPDAVNHKNFPTTIITKDNPYYHSMSISFTTM
ncbi:unnamed protein product [Cuscuta epithymum]|uniref:Aldose 1-epimerase n=1 Tax=Cuscuta epithymum TaxID=186058 RepID=A0AAV0C2I3_9ASTE|nr:unnamed protein product [Cuscuta epithymum]